MKLRTLVTKYVESRKLAGSTVEQISFAIQRFEQHLGRPPVLRDLSADAINRFIATRLKGGLSPRTIKRERQSLTMLWRWAFTRGMVQSEPGGIQSVKIPKRRQPAWTESERQRILDACLREPDVRGWTPAHWVALVNVLTDTSLQVSRIMSLDRAAVDLDRGAILVPAGGSTRGAAVVHRLSEHTLASIRMLPPSKSTLLFPWNATLESLRIHYRRIVKEAGLPATRYDMFQRLTRRHHTATWQ